MLPKASAYVKCCDGETIQMYFSVEDDELLESYNGIDGVWNKASNSIKRELDWEHIYNKKIF